MLETSVAFFKEATLALSVAVELAAALIIALAAAQATWRALRAFFMHGHAAEARVTVRLQLGKWLALALEFLLAADILRTAVAPTWDEIGKLAAIIVLRTLLNFFLEKEVDRVEERHKTRHAGHLD